MKTFKNSTNTITKYIFSDEFEWGKNFHHWKLTFSDKIYNSSQKMKKKIIIITFSDVIWILTLKMKKKMRWFYLDDEGTTHLVPKLRKLVTN